MCNRLRLLRFYLHDFICLNIKSDEVNHEEGFNVYSMKEENHFSKFLDECRRKDVLGFVLVAVEKLARSH